MNKIALFLLVTIAAISPLAAAFSQVFTDLEITKFEMDSNIVLGEDVPIAVEVKNNGDYSISTFLDKSATLEIVDETAGIVIATEVIENLMPGESKAFTFTYENLGLPKGLHKVIGRIDSKQEIIEHNETNNENGVFAAVGIPPVVDIYHLPENPTNRDIIKLYATAEDSDGYVTYIGIYVDGSQKSYCIPVQNLSTFNCTSAPLIYGAGTHNYWAEAQDNHYVRGRSDTKTFTVRYINQPPSVWSWIERIIGTSRIKFHGDAIDNDGTIKNIKFKVDGTEEYTCIPVEQRRDFSCIYTGGPYTAGQHTYEVLAQDNLDGIGSSGVKDFNI